MLENNIGPEGMQMLINMRNETLTEQLTDQIRENEILHSRLPKLKKVSFFRIYIIIKEGIFCENTNKTCLLVFVFF